MAHKHFTLEDRIFIEESLNSRLSINLIALQLDKHPSTISKEIAKHKLKIYPKIFYDTSCHICAKRGVCKITNLCNTNCYSRCAPCKKQNKNCDQIEEELCSKLKKFPYICNCCDKKCNRKIKFYYRGEKAHKDYLDSLVNTRTGISLSLEELDNLQNLIKPLIHQGQSIAMIYANHQNEIPISQRTLYEYIEDNILSIKNIDLPRKVSYKPRKSVKERIAKNRVIRNNRTYIDFLKYIDEFEINNIVEMDTVEGKKGESESALLTFLFRSSNLMLAFKLESKNVNTVLDKFDYLEDLLGLEKFQEIFEVILTDNGSEFSNPDSLETSKSEEKIRTKIFFCDPGACYQKGKLEKNHEYIRYFIPKGSSFNNISQKLINTMLSHINNAKRASLNNNSPYDLALMLLGKEVLDKLNIIRIEQDSIVLKPYLLKE